MRNPPAPPHELNGPYKTYVSTMATTYAYSNGSVAQYYRTKQSVKTPNFRTLQDRRQLPWNPYFQEDREDRYRANGQMVKVYSGGTFERTTGYVYHLAPISSLPWPDRIGHVDNLATMRIREKLQNSSINLAQSWAERRQAIDMIARTVNRLASAALAIRRGTFDQAANLLGMKYTPRLRKLSKKQGVKNAVADNLSRYWLEFQYGWKPLLSDIHGLAELIAKSIHENRPLQVTTTTKGTGSHNGDNISYVDYGASGHFKEQLFGTVERKVRYVIEFGVDSKVMSTLGSTGVTDPATLAWELLPYSFVVDWFIPVGDYINSLNATQGLVFKRGSKSVFTNYNLYSKMSSTTPWYSGLWSVERDPGRESIKILRKQRSILTEFPMPQIPSPEPYVNATRALSGIALINTAFGRSVRANRWTKIPSRFHY